MTVNTTAPIETLQLSPRQPQAPPNTPTGPVAAAPAGLASAVTAAAGTGSATSSTASTPTIPAAPANTPVSPSRPALPSPLGKTPPTKFSDDEDDESSDDDGKLPHEAADLLPNASLVKYANFKSFVSLVVTPFFQGMFYGFGEGTAKVLIGRWFGIDPLTALGGNPALQTDRRRRRKPFDFFGLFGRKRDAGSVITAAQPEMGGGGGPVGWISSKLRSNAIEGSNGGEVGLKYFSMGMDDGAAPPSVSGFSRQDDRRSAFT
ncbi:hypothetical protein BDZ88DRAFT_413864 [Geranomyces variabilis]|nr:hypothetical protein BDZ88DRAFT_413864 [Geranomyces variabilis]KAJ3137130.1 hypothetical protein HDU90_002302 [Geranomyces variabilis]